MKRPQFSILALLGLIAFVAVACTSLVNADDLWARILVSTTAIALTVSLLLCIFRRGARQAFWIGFALCGWLYWISFHWSPSEKYQEFMGNFTHNSDLATSRLLLWTYQHVLPLVRTPPPPQPTFGGGGGGFFGPGPVGDGSGMGAASDGLTIDVPAFSSGLIAQFGGAAPAGGGMTGGGMTGGGMPTMGGMSAALFTPAAPAAFYPTLDAFVRVGQPLWTLILAFLGGLLARYLHATQTKHELASAAQASVTTGERGALAPR